MIQIKNICKSYGDIQANSDVSLDIEDGKITGLIGPDGAGKSTLMRQLCALISPDSGHIQIDGLDTVKNQHQIRSMMGYMPQRFSLYPDLTVEQNILFFADLFNVPDHERKNRLEQLYQFSTLGPFKKRPAGKLSGGMKQKLALSCNLVHTPKYLILDEPTFGVDPVSRQEFWELIFQLKEDGVTVFVSTPYLDEAEMFDKVALMFRSRLIDYKVPEKIISDFPYEIYVVKSDHYAYFKDLPEIRHIHYFANDLHIAFEKAPQTQKWQEWLEKGLILNYFQRKASLEDVFLAQE
ncbi:MAG TPA: ABC transporter ATP-binding protein [Candidatus Cloacimonadota bacterium]|nr:ABC transporter ATP-binding protein [Candidatus Cloacimonadota bacterium]